MIDEIKKRPKTHEIYPAKLGETTRQILARPVRNGTATHAQIGSTFVAGKTGTTENYGDAWFVGFTEKYTVAVWVGYADKLQPMKTEYNGQPVAGGTFPTEIWRKFMVQAIAIDERRNPPTRRARAPPAPRTVPPADAAGAGGGRRPRGGARAEAGPGRGRARRAATACRAGARAAPAARAAARHRAAGGAPATLAEAAATPRDRRGSSSR